MLVEVNKSILFPFLILKSPKAEGQFATRSRSAITSRGAYPRVNSKESPHSQQKAHQDNKSASNGCKSAREERCIFTKMITLGTFLLLQSKDIITI
jgi:hypothetical protein